MNKLEEEFVKYPEALELKQLGFDEPCFTIYEKNHLIFCIGTYQNNLAWKDIISAPTYSQSFRFFREKYKLHGEPFSQKRPSNNFMYAFKISDTDIMQDGYKTHEEAEHECLKKLIEIVKQNENNKIHQ